MLTRYLFNGSEYTLSLAKTNEIINHLDAVSQWIPYVHLDDLIRNIYLSVQNKSGYVINEGSKFSIFFNKEADIYNLISVYTESPEFLAMFFHYSYFSLPCKQIQFYPSTNGADIIPFQSILDANSVRKNPYYNTPLVIDLSSNEIKNFCRKNFTDKLIMEHEINGTIPII